MDLDPASRPLALIAPDTALSGSRAYFGGGAPAAGGGAGAAGGPGAAGEPGTAAGPGGSGAAGAADGAVIPQFSPAAAAPKTSRLALKNWRVRSRLLLLVLLPTLAAVILGGVSVVSSARSALAYQRVEQFSRLGGQITSLIQAIQAEREDTIRYITMGPAGGGRGSPGAAAGPELALLAQDRQATDQLARRVRSGAVTIGRSYPALAQQEAKGAITAIDGLPALRSVATSTRIPSLAVIQEYAATITQLLALEDEIGKRRVGKECRSRWSPYH